MVKFGRGLIVDMGTADFADKTGKLSIGYRRLVGIGDVFVPELVGKVSKADPASAHDISNVSVPSNLRYNGYRNGNEIATTKDVNADTITHFWRMNDATGTHGFICCPR